jgi:exodeoxyribonuclease VII small subunit
MSGKGKKAPGEGQEAPDRGAPEPAAGEAPSFSQAIEELEAILSRIEGEEIDIDDLARELKRASELLEIARVKVRKAETEVTQIVQSLEEGAEGQSQ